MSQIRITKTIELEEILSYLRLKWPLMDEVEIVKMAISSFFQQKKSEFTHFLIEYLDENQSHGIGPSRLQAKQWKTTKYESENFLTKVME